MTFAGAGLQSFRSDRAVRLGAGTTSGYAAAARDALWLASYPVGLLGSVVGARSHGSYSIASVKSGPTQRVREQSSANGRLGLQRAARGDIGITGCRTAALRPPHRGRSARRIADGVGDGGNRLMATSPLVGFRIRGVYANPRRLTDPAQHVSPPTTVRTRLSSGCRNSAQRGRARGGSRGQHPRHTATAAVGSGRIDHLAAGSGAGRSCAAWPTP